MHCEQMPSRKCSEVRKRQHLQSETLEAQLNQRFLNVVGAEILWLFCHKAIYKITFSEW
jgi:hypothetical protein